MVYFFSIDVVLGREKKVRQAWKYVCHLPQTKFVSKKGRPRRRGSSKNQCFDYPFFKRMVICKKSVYENHKRMLVHYERYCESASLRKYWSDDDDSGDEDGTVKAAEATNEVVCDDGF